MNKFPKINPANPVAIVGAGLAGLMAAYAWPTAPIFEARPAEDSGAEHRALLRFRSDAVSKLTGIPFRRVLVRKGVWSRGAFVEPNIALANSYARKCLGALVGERSVWSVQAAERWVAPEDLYAQMLDAAGNRVRWGVAWDAEAACAAHAHPVISTAPMAATLRTYGVAHGSTFARAPIRVLRYRLPPGTDLYQTVYFPDEHIALYRASITGSLLICESRDVADAEVEHEDAAARAAVAKAFALAEPEMQLTEAPHRQSHGKILPLPDPERKNLLFALTTQHRVYSLGRFATWRNILLDDVVNDIAAIRRMLLNSAYDQALEAHK